REDLNLRGGLSPPTPLAGERIRPLCHVSWRPALAGHAGPAYGSAAGAPKRGGAVHVTLPRTRRASSEAELVLQQRDVLRGALAVLHEGEDPVLVDREGRADGALDDLAVHVLDRKSVV